MSKFLDIVRHDCGPRYDANETAAFSRELEYVFGEVIEAKYPELKFRNVIPIISGAPLGMTAHRWFEVDGFGEAKFLDNMATDDFPTAEVRGTENTGKIRSLGAKYMVTVEELRAAEQMRVKVEIEKPKLARRAIETLLDKTVWGARSTKIGGFEGLINDNSSTAWTGTPANWFTESTAGGDPTKIVANVRDALDESFIATKGAFQLFDLLVAPEIGVLLGRPMIVKTTVSAVDSFTPLNMSILQYMLATVPKLRSVSIDNFRLTAAGASSKHRCLAYPRDPVVLDAFLPLDFEQFAPQLSGMAFVTHCHAKFGGLRIKHPKAVVRFDLAAS